MRLLIVTLFVLLCAPAALAQETEPGEACTAGETDYIRQVGGPETSGVVHLMRCDGSNWQQYMTFLADSKVGIGIDDPQAPLEVAGEIKFSSSGLSCGTAQEGAVRYTGGDPPWEFCDGSAWVNFKQPRCQDDDTGECYLDATRSNDDPEFVAANVADGVNILGVTGTLSGCAYIAPKFTDLTNIDVSTQYSSEILLIDTDSCSPDVAISGSGSPQFQICDDDACSSVDHAWGSTTQTIDDGQYLQIRQTSSASDNTTQTATFTIGTTDFDWDITTDGDKFVFITSTLYNGNLGGVAGADTKCQAHADAASLGGTFKAWIADDTDANAPAARFYQSPNPYKLTTGTTVANNWADLTDGTLSAAIDYFETGAHRGSSSNNVYTNVNTDGTRKGTDSCLGWTWSSSGQSGEIGFSTVTDSTWTDDSTAACSSTFFRLYCFQQ